MNNQGPSSAALLIAAGIIIAKEIEELQLNEKDLKLISDMYARFLKANGKDQ